MNAESRVQSAFEQLNRWGYRVVQTGKNHFYVECGSSQFYVTGNALGRVAEQEPVTVKSPHGRKTHRAIRIDHTYITPCGLRWPVKDIQPAATSVSCTICRDLLGDTPSQGSRVLEGIQRMGDKIVSLFSQENAASSGKSENQRSACKEGAPVRRVSDEMLQRLEELYRKASPEWSAPERSRLILCGRKDESGRRYGVASFGSIFGPTAGYIEGEEAEANCQLAVDMYRALPLLIEEIRHLRKQLAK